MTQPIGPQYQRRNLVLTAGNDFVATFTPQDSRGEPLPSFGWPDGTRVLLLFGPLGAPPRTVEAAVEPAAVRVRIESEVADTIAAGTEVRAQLRLPGEPSTELPWFKGKVRRDD